jgi:predicted transcriptional regulator
MPHLGGLETKVMDVLWNTLSPLSVREVHDSLAPSSELAYTTILTVLDRLAKKGLATRTREGKAWSYSAAASRDAMLVAEIQEALRQPGVDRLAVVMAVAEQLSEAERAHLTLLLGHHDLSPRRPAV